MMKKLTDILADRQAQAAPTELQFIKSYVKDKYGLDVTVGLQNTAILVVVPSAALAGTLRLSLPAIQKAANTTKRIIIRIQN